MSDLEHARALTTTVVAIVSPASKTEACETLSVLSRVSGLRAIVISLGDQAEPPRRQENGAIIIDDLVPKYLDNAVASLRLSSLPAIAWWRAGDGEVLKALSGLVDRVVLDLDDPRDAWALVPELGEQAPVSDIRWARLTRWRDLVAQFFDLAEVRSARWQRLVVSGADPHDCALMIGWLRSRLPGGRDFTVVHEPAAAPRLRSVELSGETGSVAVRLRSSGSCLETVADLRSGHMESRVVARGDDRLPTLLGQELRVRSRDLAFEDAVRALERR